MKKVYAIETASRDEIRALQTERLKWTLNHVYRNVPHYRARFDAAGVHPMIFSRWPTWRNSPSPPSRICATTIPRHVRRTARGRWCASMPPAARPANRPSSAIRKRTSTPGPTWSPARSTPRAAGRATSSMSPTATACSGGLGAHYGAERLGCTVIPMSGGQTEKQVQLICDFSRTSSW